MARYKWRLYVDEDIEKEIVDNLTDVNFDVIWVKDNNEYRNRDDTFHFRKARQLQRYIITKDQDFWDDRKFHLHQSPGVIILSSSNIDMGSLLIWLVRHLIHDVSDPDDPIYLNNIKKGVSEKTITIKYVDRTNQKKTIEQWTCEELGLNLGTS